MRTYTLHVDEDAPAGDVGALEEARLVPEGFSWGAFIFTFLWFFAQRLWLAGLGAFLAIATLFVVLRVLNVTPGAAILAEILLAGLIGLEANALKRWSLARKGHPAVDVVSASDAGEAETKSFARWLAQGRTAPARPSAVPASYRAPDPIIGLFPDAEGRR